MGNPNDPGFQKDVLKQALSLLEQPGVPVLQDYPYDADPADSEPAIPACPVDFSTRPDSRTDMEKLLEQFQAEFSAMNSWHTIARYQSRRTTTGLSGMTPDSIIRLFSDFIHGRDTGSDTNGLADLLRLAAEDTKAFYFEALSAQPDQPTDAQTLSNWFWGTTCAAMVINEVRTICLSYQDTDLLLAGKLLLVPRSQLHRFE